MFTPLFQGEAPVPSVAGQWIACRNCGTALSKHSRVDFTGNFWACLSCLNRNPLPSDLDPQHPALLSDTVEYVQTVDSEARPTFIFVVDTCLTQEELDALKRNLIRSVEWLPPLSLVGFVTFGHGVTLWELGCQDLNKCYSIRGSRKYEASELSAMLNLTDGTPVGRFLCPLDECDFALSSIIEELSVDPFPVAVGFRPERACGTAIDIAVRLLEFMKCPSSCGKVVLLTGGPATRGPGSVVGIKKDEMLRFHRDFMDGNVPHYQAALTFYNDIAARLLQQRASLDAFAESFDQVGITELRRCVNQTGGCFVCGDTFDHDMFTFSFERLFARSDVRREESATSAAFALEIEVHMSGDTLISGAIGPCEAVLPSTSSSPEAKQLAARHVSPTVMGSGGTSKWVLSAADEALTITFVFDTETSDAQSAGAVSSVPTSSQSYNKRFFQFVTKYVTAAGQRRVRITSVTQPVAPTQEPSYFVRNACFDQACAAAVISRMAVSLLEAHENRWEGTKRWVDRLLVSFVRRFGTFTIGQPDSLRLSPCLSLFPSFMFNLRRSEYFMILNISPDETTFKRHWLMREPCDACVLMIQPTLMSYTLQHPIAAPVPLDSTSLVADHVLLMDAYFNVHILYGATVHEWMKMKWHENPEYAHFKAQLDAPEQDVAVILGARFPYPRFSRTDANGSESRHVKTRMNPTHTHNTSGARPSGGAANPQQQGDVIYTDDASVIQFMQSLKAAAVAPEKN